MKYKSKCSKACDISQKTKQRVHERDNGLCIFCGRLGDPVAHVIPRSHGGLGIEQNIVTACPSCHMMMDNSVYRQAFIDTAEEYLRGIYGDLEQYERVYRKGKT